MDGGRGAAAPAPPAPPRAGALAPAAGRARISAARAARHDALGRRGAASQNCAGARARRQTGSAGRAPGARDAGNAGHPQAVHLGRAHHGASPRGHAHAVPRAGPSRGRRAHGSGDRASPRRHQARRLDHRSGPRRGRRRRPGGRLRHAGRNRAAPGLSHRSLSGRPRVNRRRADVLLLGATAIWGVSFVAVKAALAYATPLAFVSLRFTLSALVLAPGTAVSPRPTRGELGGALLLTGLLAVGFATQNT